FRNWFPVFICDSDTCRYAELADNGQCVREYSYLAQKSKALSTNTESKIVNQQNSLKQKQNAQSTNADNNKNSADFLFDSIKKGHDGVIKYSLRECTDENIRTRVNTKDNQDFTALMYASLIGHTAIVKIFLDCHANVNFQDLDGYT